jgi:hypothetical protein
MRWHRVTDRPLEVEGLDWPDFVGWFRTAWEPGDHLSVIAPTKAGKTTLVNGLLSMRRYVLALDPKGGDETLAALKLRRLPAWPGDRRMERLIADDEEHGRKSHYIVGPVVQRGADLPALKKAIQESLDGAFDMGGWTVYVDELQIAADRRMMDLSGSVAKLLVAARSKGVTFVSSFQGPSWVPSEAMRQPYWAATSYTRDTDTVGRLAEVMGRSKAEMRGVIRGLDEHVWIVIGRNPREPIRLTRPPMVKPFRETK